MGWKNAHKKYKKMVEIERYFMLYLNRGEGFESKLMMIDDSLRTG